MKFFYYLNFDWLNESALTHSSLKYCVADYFVWDNWIWNLIEYFFFLSLYFHEFWFRTCASVATTKPNVKAIWVIVGLYPSPHPWPVVLAIPMATKKNAPKNSANKILNIFRLFVISLTPMIRLTPAKKEEEEKIGTWKMSNRNDYTDTHIHYQTILSTWPSFYAIIIKTNSKQCQIFDILSSWAVLTWSMHTHTLAHFASSNSNNNRKSKTNKETDIHAQDYYGIITRLLPFPRYTARDKTYWD